MRGFKVNLFLGVIVLFSSTVLASTAFYERNSDLRRVGLEEMDKMSQINFEDGNYRLDPDFQLGYGDTVVVNLWGKIEGSHSLVLDRSGNIVIPRLGRLNLIGLSLKEAQAAVRVRVEKQYSNVQVNLNIGDVQDIRVTISGNVSNPGPYAVSPFCRLVEAAAQAGGPNEHGSLANIELIRAGQKVASFNIYDFIFKSDQRENLRLRHGDVIHVPAVKNLVAVRGAVLYPGIYEFREGTQLTDIIDMVGGVALAGIAEAKAIILRVDPQIQTVKITEEIIFELGARIAIKPDLAINNEDTVIITTPLDYTPRSEDSFKMVSVSGAVQTPGSYLIKQGEQLSALLKRCGGLKDDAFSRGAVFTRVILKNKQQSILDETVAAQERMILTEEARLSAAILPEEEKELRQRTIDARRKALDILASRSPKGRLVIDLDQIIKGKEDIVLSAGDSLSIPIVPDWVLVSGAVYNPQAVLFKKGKSWEYYLNLVGGLTNFADKDQLYIIKPNGKVQSNITGYGKVGRGDIIVVPERVEMGQNR